MAKPILVVRVPKGTNMGKAQVAYNFLRDTMLDYNSIVAPSSSEEFTFEVFNVQDYPQINFEELKAKLLDKIDE